MWNTLSHGKKILYGKKLAEAVRSGIVKDVVIIDDNEAHKEYSHN